VRAQRQQVVQVGLEVRQTGFGGHELLQQPVIKGQDLGLDPAGGGAHACVQRRHTGHRGLVGRVGAVLRVAQVGEGAHAHQAGLHGFQRCQALQQRGGIGVQPPLVGDQRLPRIVHRLVFGGPGRLVGEQVVQVPGGVGRNAGARQACLHGGGKPDVEVEEGT